MSNNTPRPCMLLRNPNWKHTEWERVLFHMWVTRARRRRNGETETDVLALVELGSGKTILTVRDFLVFLDTQERMAEHSWPEPEGQKHDDV